MTTENADQQIKEIIRRELPELVREDPEIRAFILDLAARHFAPREQDECKQLQRILSSSIKTARKSTHK